MTCKYCAGPLKYGKVYCSYLCQRADERAAYIERWKAGEESGLQEGSKTLGISGHVRTWLLQVNNYSCSCCGWDKRHPDDDMPLVEIDHIDGDASNNRPENLRVLCPNCHSMTPTFRARNKNSKRTR